jgi:hypothetical protein
LVPYQSSEAFHVGAERMPDSLVETARAIGTGRVLVLRIQEEQT